MRGCLELVICFLLLHTWFEAACGLPPNFEDMDLSVDQAVDEVVNIVQQDPHSNNIHIGHNNPKNSDITVEQSNPFNTTVHISLNVGTGSKVYVKMTNARNLQLHVSFNGMGSSECTVEIDKAFNSTVHLSFQNPSSTPVTVTMNKAEISSLHVSQNIPRKSPMTVSMEEAKNCQIHLSQAVPMSSPLTWKMTGDPELNQIEVSQNAADADSPLDCTPECPQVEYVYDYQYAGSAHADVQPKAEDDPIFNDVDFVDEPVDPIVEQKVIIEEYDNTAISNPVETIPALPAPGPASTLAPKKPGPPTPATNTPVPKKSTPALAPSKTPAPATTPTPDKIPPPAFHPSAGAPVLDSDDYADAELGQTVCPGGGLEACVDVCPGQYGPRVFGACVTSCGSRCP